MSSQADHEMEDHAAFSVAVIGMSGRFPGADGVAAFWRNLREGVESITFFTDDELRAAGVPREEREHPDYVPAFGALEGIDLFDAGFWGYSPREAETLEPAHRLFLECAWEAMEDAGHDPDRVSGAVGVFAAAAHPYYTEGHVRAHRELAASVGEFQLTVGSAKDFLATRTSYKLNLRGPSMSVQTGCSSSLVAVHLATQALLRHECDLALAGGTNVVVPQAGYEYSPGGISSPDGHCRAFDARSAGVQGGSGVGVVTLKRLEDALRDGDRVRAVIRGSAVNNDGSVKVAFTAPSVAGQAAVIREALEVADVDPETIGFVEGHGSGTDLGDPIEVAALTQAYRSWTDRRQYAALGSVKTNLGHLDTAAGIAGFVKTVLAVENGEVPPTLHFERPNPKIDFAGSPFFVNNRLLPWPETGGPRRAGVSSFGIGGTNAHVVLEEAPAPRPSAPRRTTHLLPLSARTPEALEAATDRLASHLRRHPELPLADVAWTLQQGRRAFEARHPERVLTAPAGEGHRPVAFLFPGVGDQYPGMARGLYDAEPAFRAEIDRSAEILRPRLGLDIREVIFPASSSDSTSSAETGGIDFRRMLGRDAPSADPNAERLNRTELAQPAVFVVEYALAKLWMSWGVVPAAVIGHSLGEYAAATVAGVFSLEDALALVAERARLVGALPGGAMLAVPLAPDAVAPYLVDGAVIAAVNAPGLCVVAGPEGAVEEVRARLEADGTVARRIAATHAFHSPMMEGAVEPLAELVGRMAPRAPSIPLLSNVTGTWLTPAEAVDPRYWARHLREPVRFDRGAAELLRASGRILLEVGPGQTLSTFVRQAGEAAAGVPAIPSLRYPYDRTPDLSFLLGALGRLWLAGVAPDWEAFHAGERLNRVPLPTYPWERRRYWVEAPSADAAGARPASAEKRADPARWAYHPSWRRSPAVRAQPGDGRVLVFADDSALSTSTIDEMRTAGREVVIVRPGERFEATSADAFTVRPGSREDHRKLVDALADAGGVPATVLHLWGATGEGEARGGYGVLVLADALGRRGGAELFAVTAGMAEVTGAEALEPVRAALLGALPVLAAEYPSLSVRAADVEAPRSDGEAKALAALVAAEVLSGRTDRVVALRSRGRWVRGWDAVSPADLGPVPLREGGVYLFVGGLRGRNERLAEYLIETRRTKLALLDPTLPHRGQWDAVVRARLAEDPLRRQIERIREMEAGGAEVLTLQVVPSEPEQLRDALRRIDERFGALHGVVVSPLAHEPEPLAAASELRLPEWEKRAARLFAELEAVEEALEGRALDFVVLESSLTPALGGVGLAGLAATHAMTDAFAQRHARASSLAWTSAGWDRWHGDDDSTDEMGMAPDEAGAAFETLLALSGEPSVLLSTADLARRVEESAKPVEEAASTVGSTYARPAMATEYHPPSSEGEARVAAIWEEILGISPVGVHDDFFGLGGHSLLATQIISRVRGGFGVELPLKTIFEAPTVARFAAVVEAALAEARDAGEPAVPAIRRRGGGPASPMSWAQERLWFLDQLEPGSPFYNIPAAALVSTRVDIPTLERAFGEVVRRHEALRTVFRLVDGEPRQIVQPPHPVHIRVTDLRGPGGEPAPEETVRRAVSDEGARPFDLAQGPLLRVDLFRVSDADYALLVNVHHIVTDGWSMPIIFREMEELYGAFTRGEPSPLPELPVQYADYSAWQREYLTGETLERQVEYWRRHMEGAPTLEIPTDRPRAPVLAYRGGIHRFVWPAALTERLKALGKELGASLNMVVMAGFNVLLQKYGGQDDVVVGTLLGNRNRAETEPLVGFFVNSAPIHLRLGGDPAFAEVVRRARTAILDADANQDLPFDKMVDALVVERDPSRNPLFQVMYFHHTFVKDLHHKEESEFADELNLRELIQETGVSLIDTHATKFDMTLATLEHADGTLANMVEYSSDLWDEETIARMMEHLRVLLDHAAAHPDAPLSGLSMVSARERERLLAWGVNEAPSAHDGATMVSLFEGWADRIPEGSAVEAADAALSYRALDERANRVARRLAALGVEAGARVGLACGHTAAMAAGALGILKAGAVVVPLDPEYPDDRLAFMAEDAGLRAVVAAGGALAWLASASVAVLDLDRDAAAVAAEDGTRPGTFVAPESAAYVIYTSGSTGRPKGVVLTHRGIARTMAAADYARVAPGDRVTLSANLSFDAALWEVWGTLLNGAALVHIPRDLLLTTREYAAELARKGITHAFLTTQLFNRHVREAPGIFRGLRYVFFGGEQVDPDAVRRCLEGGPPAHLLHMYGPAETTVYATWHEVAQVAADAHTVPIGGPVAGTRVYVLDPSGRPAGVGVPGELFVGGERVARGYLGRPGLTADRFVPDPFAGAGARMYRTGDRARWVERESGDASETERTHAPTHPRTAVLEFLGRFDEQVKVRGFRVEPGEVAAALRAHPAVADAAVIVREDAPGDRRLAGYVAGPDRAALEAADFRAFLKERLPDYMVPSAFVAVDAIPLTPNGKVDRAKLPAPAAAPVDEEAFAAPRTPAEATLARVWAEALGVERVGVHDNFFALGGDSILTIGIIARAVAEGVHVTPKQMFTHPTVAELAAVAGAAAPTRAEQGVVTGAAPLTPVQRWFFAQELVEPHFFNLALLFRPREALDAALVERAIAALLAHHDALRLRFSRGADGWEQAFAGADGPVPFEHVDLSIISVEGREAALAERASALQSSLDLQDGPLVRFALFEMGDGGQRLLLIAHHLAMDAVSLGVLTEDLETAYHTLARGGEVRLPPKTTSFRAWAERLAAHARTPDVKAELPFWRAQAGDALPVDFDGGANTEGDADRVVVELSEEETRALLHDVPAVYHTRINDALLAALAMALQRWTGGAPAVDLEGHGREDLFEGVDLSRTAGWFTAIHPLRLELPADSGPGEALRAVKEHLRAVPANGIGHGLLRWMSGDAEAEAALRAIPQPRVSFNYLGRFDAAEDPSRLLAPVDGEVGPSRAPRNDRPHLLAIDAAVSEGRLGATWTYGTRVHQRATVERLAAAWTDALRELIEHCRDPEAGGFTRSDFVLEGFDQEDFNALISQIGE